MFYKQGIFDQAVKETFSASDEHHHLGGEAATPSPPGYVPEWNSAQQSNFPKELVGLASEKGFPIARGLPTKATLTLESKQPCW